MFNEIDITKCSSNCCPHKNDCYRVQAKPNPIQSYANFEYTCNENSGFCDFIKMPVKQSG